MVYYREFYYISLAYSPITGMSFLLVYKHSSNQTVRDVGARNQTDYSQSEVLIIDQVNLTRTTVNVDHCNLSYFVVNEQQYVSVQDKRVAMVYRIGKLQVSIDKELPFSRITEASMDFSDHTGKLYHSIPLTVFFREKKAATWMWLIISLSAIGLGVVLIVVYLIFKKPNTGLNEEISNGIKSARKPKKDSNGFEVELL